MKHYLKAVFGAVVIALLVRSFVIEAYRVPSDSMKPTLIAGDVIFVAKWPYGLRLPLLSTSLSEGRAPERGEVVIFSSPSDPGRDYVRRVVALPGDTVAMMRGKIFVNEQPAKDLAKSIAPGCEGESAGDARYTVCRESPLLEDFGPETVSENHVFVIGDLRSQAGPSKTRKGWGQVPLQNLRGQALWVWLSLDPKPREGEPKLRRERMFLRIQ